VERLRSAGATVRSKRCSDGGREGGTEQFEGAGMEFSRGTVEVDRCSCAVRIRLCRLMGGRALLFRGVPSSSGLRPGCSPNLKSPTVRWGGAATAHQTAEPKASEAAVAVMVLAAMWLCRGRGDLELC
jgi:hypothetical protein